MYSEKARELRRCTAIKPNGEPCRAWACWDSPALRCVAHVGRHHRGPILPGYNREKTRYRPCKCIAYAWPHRPGGGLCQWPDPPSYRLTIPAGTHSWPRLPARMSWVKQLERLWRKQGRWGK